MKIETNYDIASTSVHDVTNFLIVCNRINDTCYLCLFQSWLIPIFWKGSQNDLEPQDMHKVLSKDHSETLGKKLERYYRISVFCLFSKFLNVR